MVTKQQQLEWLAKEFESLPFHSDSILMSDEVLGSMGYEHRITNQEIKQGQDKMQKQPAQPAPDNSWYERGEFPPAGSECEVAPKSGGAWIKAVILAVTNQNVIMLVNDEPLEVVSRASNVIFRPLRTEREKEIEEMTNLIAKSVFGSAKCQAEKLYDAGYRKVNQ